MAEEANGGIERKHRAIVGSSPSSFPSGTSIGHYHGGMIETLKARVTSSSPIVAESIRAIVGPIVLYGRLRFIGAKNES